jgi:hypothetical protein
MEKLTSKTALFSILIFFIFVKILESLYPFGHGDPLYYHLTIAKVWSESNWSDAHLQVCGALQGGLLEYLYIIPIALFKNSILRQTSSQLLQFFLTFGIITFFIVRYYLKENVLASIFFLISIFTINRGSDFFLFAKNDGLLASLGFIATIMVLDKKFYKLKNYDMILGLILGLIPLVKINGIMITLVLNLIYLFKNARTRSYSKILINWSMQLVFFSLLIWRNWYFYKSPLFPAFLNVFPGVLTPSMINTFTYYMSSKVNWDSFKQILTIFFSAKIVLLTIPIFFYLNVKKERHFLNSIFVVSLVILTLLILKSGGMVYERWFFVCYFLNLFFVIFSWDQIPPSKFKTPLLLLLLLLDSRLDQSLKRIFRLKSKYESIESFSNKNKLWKFIPENSMIISDRWNEFFHAPTGVRVHSAECNIQAGFLDQCTEADLIKLRPYHFAILINPKTNPCYEQIKSQSTIIDTIEDNVVFKLKK